MTTKTNVQSFNVPPMYIQLFQNLKNPIKNGWFASHIWQWSLLPEFREMALCPLTDWLYIILLFSIVFGCSSNIHLNGPKATVLACALMNAHTLLCVTCEFGLSNSYCIFCTIQGAPDSKVYRQSKVYLQTCVIYKTQVKRNKRVREESVNQTFITALTLRVCNTLSVSYIRSISIFTILALLSLFITHKK